MIERATMIFLSLVFAAQYASFDVPGAASGTFPTGINASGTVVGYFWTQPSTAQGFIRTSDGTITVYNVPNSYYTQPTAINAAGDIAGYFTPMVTPIAYPTGFVLTATGVLSTFTTPDSTLVIYAMNDLDEVTGVGDTGGYVASAPGNVSLFWAPLPADGAPETIPIALNNSGAATGYAFDQVCGGSEGEYCVDLFKRSFIRAADGTITEFEMPDSARTQQAHTDSSARPRRSGTVWTGSNSRA